MCDTAQGPPPHAPRTDAPACVQVLHMGGLAGGLTALEVVDGLAIKPACMPHATERHIITAAFSMLYGGRGMGAVRRPAYACFREGGAAWVMAGSRRVAMHARRRAAERRTWRQPGGVIARRTRQIEGVEAKVNCAMKRCVWLCGQPQNQDWLCGCAHCRGQRLSAPAPGTATITHPLAYDKQTRPCMHACTRLSPGHHRCRPCKLT